MSYENAPATKLLATHCCCCGRPLLDATSVELGIGPDCRRKFGYAAPDGAVDLKALEALGVDTNDGEIFADRTPREMANKLVHEVACGVDRARLSKAIGMLAALGFRKLATRLGDQATKLRVEVEGDELVVRAPYDACFVEATRAIPGRRWVKETKVTRFPRSARRAVWGALVRCFPGGLLATPKGARRARGRLIEIDSRAVDNLSTGPILVGSPGGPAIEPEDGHMGKISWTTRAAFFVGGAWKWVRWTHNEPNSHAAIIAKSAELGASCHDFGQADHAETSRFSFF